MPAKIETTKSTPMTFRGSDGRVHKTPEMELSSREVTARQPEYDKRTWLGFLLSSPD